MQVQQPCRGQQLLLYNCERVVGDGLPAGSAASARRRRRLYVIHATGGAALALIILAASIAFIRSCVGPESAGRLGIVAVTASCIQWLAEAPTQSTCTFDGYYTGAADAAVQVSGQRQLHHGWLCREPDFRGPIAADKHRSSSKLDLYLSLMLQEDYTVRAPRTAVAQWPPGCQFGRTHPRGTTTRDQRVRKQTQLRWHSREWNPASGHSITAKYLGDSNLFGSTSSALNQVVNQAVSATAVTSSTGSQGK